MRQENGVIKKLFSQNTSKFLNYFWFSKKLSSKGKSCHKILGNYILWLNCWTFSYHFFFRSVLQNRLSYSTISFLGNDHNNSCMYRFTKILVTQSKNSWNQSDFEIFESEDKIKMQSLVFATILIALFAQLTVLYLTTEYNISQT